MISSTVSSDLSLNIITAKESLEVFPSVPCTSLIQTPYTKIADWRKTENSHDVTICCKSVHQNGGSCSQRTRKKITGNIRMLGDLPESLLDKPVDNFQGLLPNTSLYLPDVHLKRETKQKQQKLKEISDKLSFSRDVMKCHGSYVMNYDDKELFKLVYREAKHGRHFSTTRTTRKQDNPIGFPQRHEICHFRRQSANSPEHKPNSFSAIDSEIKQELEDVILSSTKTRRLSKFYSHALQHTVKSLPSNDWDEYVLALLSRSTATLLIEELPSGQTQNRLTNFLGNYYSTKKCENDKHLLHATTPEVDGGEKHHDCKLGNEIDKALMEMTAEPHCSTSISVPTVVDEKKVSKNNLLPQGLMTFNRYGRKQRGGSLLHDTSSFLRFEKKLQANFPENPKKWSLGSHARNDFKFSAKRKVVKGLRRWNELPSLLQDDSYTPSFRTFEKPSETKREVDLTSAHKMRQNNSILRISEEWQNKWLLEKRWQSASTEQLIRGMNDINDHVRLTAVASCSRAVAQKQRKKNDRSFVVDLTQDSNNCDKENVTKELEPELLECISKLLDDKCKQVQITAAITLCSYKSSEPKVMEILKDSVQNGSDVERWLASQCLALSGCCADYIITELLSQTSGTDLVRQEQATVLLLKLSHQTSLVHAVVAELLNSNSCHDRLVACRLLPRLKGSLNKDIAQKLSYMMWNDWENSVKTAAAQALGRAGNGKLVHDALLERLSDHNERTQTDALSKLANLGVMTPHLLPAFLACFKSEFVSVRLQAAKASGEINTSDEGVLSALLSLANEDYSWKVMAHSINAIGTIGVVNEDVIEMLNWNMRYNKTAAVRAEACNAVARLGIKDARTLSALQDRLIVETNETVIREAERALRCLQIEFTGDLEMISAIRAEVKRLCEKENVLKSIIQVEKHEDHERDFKRLISINSSLQENRKSESKTEGSAVSNVGWNPILAGFRARSVFSEPSVTKTVKMERSRLPIDLNSATSEGSQRTKSDLETEYSDSIRSKSRSTPNDENIYNEKVASHFRNSPKSTSI